LTRQQINVLRRQAPKRPHFNNTDRFLFVWLYRWFPSVLGAIAIVRPETIIRWHRAGFRAYWRWRSRNHVGRPKVSAELRTLIGEMSRANPLWGAPHIHGELLKLGFDVAQSTVARHMCRQSRPPSQGWRTFLSNHADGIAAVDLFVLPTIAFRILYCFVIIRPPAHAVVLSVDEKSQIQALDRTQPGLPMQKGRAGTMTHDYKRHGTTTLFAALNVLDGTVIGRNMQRHRHQEFIRFLNAVVGHSVAFNTTSKYRSTVRDEM
jgi:hypothetical protein